MACCSKIDIYSKIVVELCCVYGTKLCDYCLKCFYPQINFEKLDEYDFWSIFIKIQGSSFPEIKKIKYYKDLLTRTKNKYSEYFRIYNLESRIPENEKMKYYENLLAKMESNYSGYVVITDLWNELKTKCSIRKRTSDY
jgi:hypothetical protein